MSFATHNPATFQIQFHSRLHTLCCQPCKSTAQSVRQLAAETRAPQAAASSTSPHAPGGADLCSPWAATAAVRTANTQQFMSCQLRPHRHTRQAVQISALLGPRQLQPERQTHSSSCHVSFAHVATRARRCRSLLSLGRDSCSQNSKHTAVHVMSASPTSPHAPGGAGLCSPWAATAATRTANTQEVTSCQPSKPMPS
jgi:hypothetical protein